MERIKKYIHLIRLPQWSKSIFVLLGVFYAHSNVYLAKSLWAAFAFCLISSAVYVYNDIEDMQTDQAHPHKSKRPVANGSVSTSDAFILMLLLLFAGLIIGWLVSKKLVLILCVYVLVNLGYNHLFKFIPILDVASIAIGFFLRVLAGTVGIGLYLSPWLLISATVLSFFIALNKRRLELNMINLQEIRPVLRKYPPKLLDGLILGSGGLCFLTYLLYVVYARSQSSYFVLTLPFAAIAIWRFAVLSSNAVENDDPVIVFIKDRLSRLNMYCFVILTLMGLGR